MCREAGRHAGASGGVRALVGSAHEIRHGVVRRAQGNNHAGEICPVEVHGGDVLAHQVFAPLRLLCRQQRVEMCCDLSYPVGRCRQSLL